MEKDLTVLSMLVWDKYGTLARISSLFSRKGHNINNLTASNTDKPDQTRITITVQGDETEIRLILAQCQKLEDVIDVSIMDTSVCVMREIVLIILNYNHYHNIFSFYFLQICISNHCC